MWEKLKNDKDSKDLIVKIITILIIASIVLLSFDVLTQSKDGRRQVVDEDGGTEEALCNTLTDIKDVGKVDVMIQYEDEEKVSGVIVTAEGAGNPVVKNDLINAVAALFNISASNVMVLEKEDGRTDNE